MIIKIFRFNYVFKTGKKQENITNAEASEHKTNGSKSSETQHSPEITKSGTKTISAELSAKITAKQNNRQKQQQQPQYMYMNGTKGNRNMDPPKLKHAVDHKANRNFLLNHNEMPNYADIKPSLSSHDVENHLSSSRIPINEFKSKSSPTPVTLNFKKNYL